MRMRIKALIVALCLACVPFAVTRPAGTAFVDVNVVPMDSERVLGRRTVVVRDGTIVTIGSVATTAVPDDVERVDAGGAAYLVPGLADMHTHVLGPEHLPVYVANGVTTMLQMGDAPAELVAEGNRRIEAGTLVGPRIFFARLVDGAESLRGAAAVTPADGREIVRRAAAEGYEFIKVYNRLTEAAFAAVVDEAERHDLEIIGHGVRAVGLPDGLFEGQVMVAHAEEFYYTAFANRPDRDSISHVVGATLESRAYVTPNLSTFEAITAQWGRPDVVEGYLADPRAAQMTSFLRQSWAERDYVSREGDIEPMLVFLREFTKALADAGVSLLAGTDSPVIPGMYPGYSIHDDLEALVRAGLSRYDALAAATRTPGRFVAEFVPEARAFGTIQIGSKADLVLVRSNPLENLETLRAPLGVMAAGIWRDAAALAALLRDRQAPR